MHLEVGVREFKNGASQYIERVEAGEILTVTRRGKPVPIELRGEGPLASDYVIEGRR